VDRNDNIIAARMEEKKETDATGKWTGYKEGDYDAMMCCCNYFYGYYCICLYLMINVNDRGKNNMASSKAVLNLSTKYYSIIFFPFPFFFL
jgi:hypothetical protein